MDTFGLPGTGRSSAGPARSDERRDEVRRLRQEGLTARAIASRTGVPEATVWDWSEDVDTAAKRDRADVVDRTTGALVELMGQAVITIADVMTSGEGDAVRLKAAGEAIRLFTLVQNQSIVNEQLAAYLMERQGKA